MLRRWSNACVPYDTALIPPSTNLALKRVAEQWGCCKAQSSYTPAPSLCTCGFYGVAFLSLGCQLTRSPPILAALSLPRLLVVPSNAFAAAAGRGWQQQQETWLLFFHPAAAAVRGVWDGIRQRLQEASFRCDRISGSVYHRGYGLTGACLTAVIWPSSRPLGLVLTCLSGDLRFSGTVWHATGMAFQAHYSHACAQQIAQHC